MPFIFLLGHVTSPVIQHNVNKRRTIDRAYVKPNLDLAIGRTFPLIWLLTHCLSLQTLSCSGCYKEEEARYEDSIDQPDLQSKCLMVLQTSSRDHRALGL